MKIIEKGKGLIKHTHTRTHTHTHILSLSYTHNLILNNKKIYQFKFISTFNEAIG